MVRQGVRVCVCACVCVRVCVCTCVCASAGSPRLGTHPGMVLPSPSRSQARPSPGQLGPARGARHGARLARRSLCFTRQRLLETVSVPFFCQLGPPSASFDWRLGSKFSSGTPRPHTAAQWGWWGQGLSALCVPAAGDPPQLEMLPHTFLEKLGGPGSPQGLTLTLYPKPSCPSACSHRPAEAILSARLLLSSFSPVASRKLGYLRGSQLPTGPGTPPPCCAPAPLLLHGRSCCHVAPTRRAPTSWRGCPGSPAVRFGVMGGK